MSSDPKGRNVKICGVCGRDVSRLPRVKDESGTYFCEGECFRRYKKALHESENAAPQTTDATEEASPWFNAALFEEPAAGKTDAAPPLRCPSCGAKMGEESILCTMCGYSAKRGARLQTRMGVSKEKGERRSAAAGLNIPSWAVALGLMVLMGATLLLSMQGDEMFIVHMGVLVLVGIVVNIGVIVAAFSQGHTGWGVVAILSYCVPFLGLAVLYYIFAVNDNDTLKAAWLIWFIMYIASIFVHMDRLQELRGDRRGLSVQHRAPADAGAQTDAWPGMSMPA